MFKIIFTFCVLQRLAELYLSKSNQRKLLQSGFDLREPTIELGWMIALHVTWFLAMLWESTYFAASLPKVIIGFALITFLGAQLLRLWTIKTLGQHWNISVLAPKSDAAQLKEEAFVDKGPYRYIRHPNYLAVILEFISLPLIGGALWTALIFSILNGIVLRRRIIIEEKFLISRIGYLEKMGKKARLIPGLI